MPLGLLYVFFGEISIKVFCPFFFLFLIELFVFLILNFINCLFILEINLLYLLDTVKVLLCPFIIVGKISKFILSKRQIGITDDEHDPALSTQKTIYCFCASEEL